MIQRPLNEITEDDLGLLVTNAVGESRTLEYKSELPGRTDRDKKEFLADVSSFANTSGGDLVYGIKEDNGVATEITGFRSADIDLEIRRLESLLASGLDPRIRHATKVVSLRQWPDRPCHPG